MSRKYYTAKNIRYPSYPHRILTDEEIVEKGDIVITVRASHPDDIKLGWRPVFFFGIKVSEFSAEHFIQKIIRPVKKFPNFN